jgi:hypothetical protein
MRLRNGLPVDSEKAGMRVEFVDLETPWGLAEAAFQEVSGDLPVIVLVASESIRPHWSRGSEETPQRRVGQETVIGFDLLPSDN